MDESTVTVNNDADNHLRDLSQNILRITKLVVCLGICLFSVGYFVYRALVVYDNFSPNINGADFLYFYSGGTLWNRNQNTYDADLFHSVSKEFGGAKAQDITPIYYFLPPATVVFGAVATMPFQTAYNVYWLINVIVTALTFVLVGIIFSWYRRIRIEEITILCLFLYTRYGRAIIEVGQISSLMFLLILLAFMLTRYERWTQAGIVLAFTIIKFSYFPLYAGYLLLKRHYRAFVICIVLSLLLCLVPLLIKQQPILQTFTDWLHMLSISTKDGTSNSPSPFASSIYGSVQLLNLEPLIYRIFNAQTLVTTIINWLVAGVLALYSAYLIVKSELTHQSRLLDFALVSLLSLMLVYHRDYDNFFAFPALLYLYIYAQQLSGSARRNWLLVFVVMLFVMISPTTLVFSVYSRLTSSELPDTYLTRLITPYHNWFNIILLGILLYLKRQQVHQKEIPSPRMVADTVAVST